MKKYIFIIVMLALFAAALSVSADSVWMPMDDYFMDTWSPETDNTCTYQDRPFYLAAGERGYVTAVKTPLDQTVLSTYPNGTEFKITFVCGAGKNLWGTIEAVRLNGEKTFKEDWQGISGYIRFDDLVRAYDSEAFTDDHRNEIKEFDEQSFDFCASGGFVLWTAPNSGVQLEFVNADYLNYLCMPYDNGYKAMTFGSAYTDQDGNRWVEAKLRREWEHGWICLDKLTDGGVEPVY